MSNPLWLTTNRYDPLAPIVYRAHPDYYIRGAWERNRDGVNRISYRAHYRGRPIYELEKSSSLIAVQDAVEGYMLEAAI